MSTYDTLYYECICEIRSSVTSDVVTVDPIFDLETGV